MTLQTDDVREASCKPTVRLNIEKVVEIRRLFWLKNFVSYRSNFILDVLPQQSLAFALATYGLGLDTSGLELD